MHDDQGESSDLQANMPLTSEWCRYETLKHRWLAEHPEATPEQVQAAMTAIAGQCEV